MTTTVVAQTTPGANNSSTSKRADRLRSRLAAGPSLAIEVRRIRKESRLSVHETERMTFTEEEAGADFDSFLAEDSAEEMVFDGGEWDAYLADEPAEIGEDSGLGGGSVEDVCSAMGHWAEPSSPDLDDSSEGWLDGPMGRLGSPSVAGTITNTIGVGTGAPSILRPTPPLAPGAPPLPASAASTGLRVLGGAASIAGIGLAGYDMAENGVGLQNSMDMGAGAAGLAGAVLSGPVGAVAGAFATGYGAGQILDQAFGISDGISGLLADDHDTGPRNHVGLGYINDKARRAKFQSMWAQTDEERAEAQAEQELFEKLRRERLEKLTEGIF